MTTALFANIENALISNISKTSEQIKIAVAWFTNPKLLAILYNLIERQKQIQIILADDEINFRTTSNFQNLIDNDAEVRVSRFPNLMHHKFCIIDDTLLITGSYNWTRSAEINNHENIIISNERNLINLFNAQFLELIAQTERLTSISSTTFKDYSSSLVASTEYHLITQVNAIQTKIENQIDGEQKAEISEEILIKLEKAEALYLNGKHENAIEVCNKIIAVRSDIADAYEIIANCKWRQGKFKEQIAFAKQAIELDNKLYSAFNILGIGYADLRNAQKSIENYQICIDAQPNEYVYYRNRALSYLDLKEDVVVPKNLREQFAKKADLDLKKVIELTDAIEGEDNTYGLYFSRGVAKLYLNQVYAAKVDLLKAKELYEATDKTKRDIHEYREIKQHLINIEGM